MSASSSDPPNETPHSRPSGLLVYVLSLSVILSLVTWGMMRGRRAALAEYVGDVARADWERWRSKASKQAAGEGPVRRRVPKSHEPPALVLMRDYFWQCLVGAWLVTGALATAMVFLFGGMLRSGNWQPIEDPVHPALRKPASDRDAE
ncbi:MAG: hypothetical protein KDB14_00130 [Planctomycetales bacterium]|nr:hypothetical protein [Planctomycetales bacterium]